MKKKIYSTLLMSALMILPLFSIGQMRDPGNPGGEPGGGDDPIGGGAPIGSGIGILMALGAAYGGKKLYTLYSENQESLEE
jgi:hypothetical protein